MSVSAAPNVCQGRSAEVVSCELGFIKDSFVQQLFVEHLFCAKQAFILGTVFLAESETDQPLPCGGALVFTG